MAIFIVNELSSLRLEVSFYDPDDNLAIPVTITWQIHDKETGTIMKAETTYTPAASTIQIAVPTAANAIVNPSKAYETRVVTVKANYGLSDGVNQEYEYRVANLTYVS